MKRFICRYTYANGEEDTWSGTVRLIRENSGMVEAFVSGRSTGLAILIGTYENGHFICIPDINVGCPLSTHWDDLFWNIEHLSKLMNETDAVTVACAVKELYRIGILG